MFTRPFYPDNTATQNAVMDGSAKLIALNNGGGSRSLHLANIGNQTVFVRLGTASVVATANDSMPVLAGTTMVVSCDPSESHLSAIGTAGSTLYVTTGSYGS